MRVRRIVFFLASQQLLLKSIPAGETAGTRV